MRFQLLASMQSIFDSTGEPLQHKKSIVISKKGKFWSCWKYIYKSASSAVKVWKIFKLCLHSLCAHRFRIPKGHDYEFNDQHFIFVMLQLCTSTLRYSKIYFLVQLYNFFCRFQCSLGNLLTDFWCTYLIRRSLKKHLSAFRHADILQTIC